MTSNPIKLVVPPPGAPNAKVIQLLREALHDARKGRIQAIGLALGCVDPEGDGGRSTETIIAYADGWAHTTAAAIGGLWTRFHLERYDQGHVLPPGAVDENDGETDP